MKSQNGMTHIMLIVCIVIIIAAIVGVVYVAQKSIEEEKLETLKTDMLFVQGKLRIVKEEVAMKKEGVAYIGKKASENLEDSDIEKLINEKVIEINETTSENLYIIELEDIKQLGLENGSLERVIVDYSNCEIIYAKGFNVEGNNYYKLSDFNVIEEQKEETEGTTEDVPAEDIAEEEAVEEDTSGEDTTAE